MSNVETGIRIAVAMIWYQSQLYERGAGHGTGTLYKGGGYTPARLYEEVVYPYIIGKTDKLDE